MAENDKTPVTEPTPPTAGVTPPAGETPDKEEQVIQPVETPSGDEPKPTGSEEGKGAEDDMKDMDEALKGINVQQALELLKAQRRQIEKLTRESIKHRQAKKVVKDQAEAEKAKLAESERQALVAAGNFKDLAEKETARANQAAKDIADRDNRIAELESEVEESKLAAKRFEIATKYGLPSKLANRLQGGTAEELEQDAKELRAAMPQPDIPTDGDRGAGDRIRQTVTDSELLKKKKQAGGYSI